MLTREQILNADDLTKQEVAIPEWGGSVFVRSMTAAERDAYESSLLDKKGNVNYKDARASLVVVSCCDESGKALFSKTDIKLLSAKNAAAVDRLFSVAQKINGMTVEDMEELTKNS